MKKYSKLIILLLFPLITYSQGYNDALNFSMNDYGGTARFLSMGGAFTALGGDLGAVNMNPAGLSVFRHNTVTLTGSFYTNTSESKYLLTNEMREDYDYNFNLNNFGIVASYSSGATKGFVNFNFGFSYNEISRFNQNLLIEGVNYYNSQLDYWVDDANYIFDAGLFDDFKLGLAYDTYLIDFDADAQEYWSDITDAGVYGLNQMKTISTGGKSGDYQFSFGTNYEDKLYLGLAFSFNNVKYRNTTSYVESDDLPETVYFQSFQFDEVLNIDGTGYKFKVGLIGRPLDWLRLGLAVHTPTFWKLDDEYYTTMYYVDQPVNIDYPEDYDEGLSPVNEFEYKLTTPFKAMAGVGFLFGKIGLISFDYEYLDYSKSRFKADNYNFHIENQDINYFLGSSHNFRVGGEFRVDVFSLRAGYNLFTSPYSDVWTHDDNTRQSFSGGFGINSGNFFFDFAYIRSLRKYTEIFYDPYIDRASNIPDGQTDPLADIWVGGNIKSISNRFMFTVGLRF